MMLAALRSEIRKVLSLRSTYIIFGLGMLLVLLMNGWVSGYKHSGDTGNSFTAGLITSTLQGTSFLLGIIVLLQITQEYRHNTIYYTLTFARRRASVILAKVVCASLIMLGGSVLFVAVGVASGVIGVAASGDSLGAQSIPWGEILTRGGMYAWGAGMYALILGLLIRNQVGSIVVYLFGAAIAEQLLGLLLKLNAGYLPFMALEGVMMQAKTDGVFSPEKSMAIVLGWIIVAGMTAWLLFKRRDAN
ncbi:hypothetical protein IPL68_02260 [Candidatus Saccharibacteria bacterium]|nr:MAG: hypothetical protein IPL68_02260 [Candidatus Saccharibacteria bacterium]